MAKINENALAKEIAIREGGKTEVNIAQIKEVLRNTLDILGNSDNFKMSEVIALLEKHG